MLHKATVAVEHDHAVVASVEHEEIALPVEFEPADAREHFPRCTLGPTEGEEVLGFAFQDPILDGRVDPRTLEPAIVNDRSALETALRTFADKRALVLDALRSGAMTPPASYLEILATVKHLTAEADVMASLATEMRPLLRLANSEAQRWQRYLPGHGEDPNKR